MNTSSRPDRRSTYEPASEGVRFWSLVTAEFQRARQTRSTLTLVTIVVGIAFIMLIVRTMLAQRSGTPLEPQAGTLSADLVGFAVLLAVAIAVARDYQTGTIDLLRTLTPARPRHLVARTVGTGLLALIAVGLVVLAGLAAVLLLGDGTVSWQLAETVTRTAITTFLLAGAGVGIGAATRSTATATFTVIALYWLIPIGSMIAGLAGAPWVTRLSEATLGILASNAITPGPEHWTAVGGITLWSAALAGLGLLRETKGN